MSIDPYAARVNSQGPRRAATPFVAVNAAPVDGAPFRAAPTVAPSLAHMSHELRTPIHAVLGYATLLHEGAGGALQQSAVDMVAQIARNARHMRELVDELLDLVRLDAGTVRPALRDIELDAVVHDALAAVEPQARAKGLSLGVRIGGAGTPRVRSDARRVRQIVLNLVANAVKFTERGGATVIVETKPSRVAVHVVDTGIGIAPADQLRVFDEFVQVGGAGAIPGSVGLGLAISRRLARVLGGDVTLRSEPGRGSCFTLTLPLDGSRLETERTDEPCAHISAARP